MHCTKCGKELPDDARFCSFCGNVAPPKKPVCPACGHELTEQAIFCCYCGTKAVPSPQAAEPAAGPVSAAPPEVAPPQSQAAPTKAVPPTREPPENSRSSSGCGSEIEMPPQAQSCSQNQDTPSQPAGQTAQRPQPANNAPHPPEREDGVCPQCGSHECEIQVIQNISESGKNYRGGRGCLGLLLLGPFGLLCGLCGAGKKMSITSKSMWVCKKCGHQFRTKADELTDTLIGEVSNLVSTIVAGIVFLILGGIMDQTGGTVTGMSIVLGIMFAGFGIAPLLWKGHLQELTTQYNSLPEDGKSAVTNAIFASVGGGLLTGFILQIILNILFNRFTYNF